MDNEALMRRISAATDAKKAKQQAHTGNPAAANPSRNAAPTAAAVQSAHPNGQRSATLSPPPPARQMPPQRQTIAPAQVPPTASAAPQYRGPDQQRTPRLPPHQGQLLKVRHRQQWPQRLQQPLESRLCRRSIRPLHRKFMDRPFHPRWKRLERQRQRPAAPPRWALTQQRTAVHPDQMSFMPPKAERMPAEEQAPRPQRSEERGQAYVVSCSGTTAIVQGDSDCVDTVTGLTWAVGRMLSIQVGANRIVGMICDIEMLGETYASGTKSMMRFHVELQG